MNLGSKIRQLRKAKNLTLSDVARKIGMTAAGLSYIELNKRRVSVQQLKAIADALGVDVRDFLSSDLNNTLSSKREEASA